MSKTAQLKFTALATAFAFLAIGWFTLSILLNAAAGNLPANVPVTVTQFDTVYSAEFQELSLEIIDTCRRHYKTEFEMQHCVMRAVEDTLQWLRTGVVEQ